MDSNKSYWVVEYRFPIPVSEASSPEEAAQIAAEEIYKQYGMKPSAWYARVFEYGPSVDEVGPLREYFCNPSGMKFRQLDKNDIEHQRLYHEKLEKEEDNE
jgi:hypothetical protein